MSWMQSHFFWPKLGMLGHLFTLVREFSEMFGRVHNRSSPLAGQSALFVCNSQFGVGAQIRFRRHFSVLPSI